MGTVKRLAEEVERGLGETHPGLRKTVIKKLALAVGVMLKGQTPNTVLSARDPHKRFDSLMHHFNERSLAACFHELDGTRAVGSDGIDKAQYGAELDANLKDLVARMKRMAYQPAPVRQVLIPKEGKPGTTRPLGISNLEDKIVQKMMHNVLESIYEPLFLECSYGFRPSRGCHGAIRALHPHLFRHDVQTVPQGSSCSPVLANVFAHEVIDQWFETVVKSHCVGRVELFRYADDAVICCQYEHDAHRIVKALKGRLAHYRLRREHSQKVGSSGKR